jgi:hypothetical protein
MKRFIYLLLKDNFIILKFLIFNLNKNTRILVARHKAGERPSPPALPRHQRVDNVWGLYFNLIAVQSVSIDETTPASLFGLVKIPAKIN